MGSLSDVYLVSTSCFSSNLLALQPSFHLSPLMDGRGFVNGTQVASVGGERESRWNEAIRLAHVLDKHQVLVWDIFL